MRQDGNVIFLTKEEFDHILCPSEEMLRLRDEFLKECENSPIKVKVVDNYDK